MSLVVSHLQVCNEQQQCLTLRHAMKISDMLHDTSCQLVSNANHNVRQCCSSKHAFGTANVSAITLRNSNCASSQAETAITGAKCCCRHPQGLTGADVSAHLPQSVYFSEHLLHALLRLHLEACSIHSDSTIFPMAIG